jgi:acyl carrier protein
MFNKWKTLTTKIFLKKNKKMNENILDIINKVLENRNKNKLTSIKPEMSLRDDIGFDSLDLAELTVRIEAEFDVDIFEDGLISTVEEIFKKIE